MRTRITATEDNGESPEEYARGGKHSRNLAEGESAG
jgi:hypothetical protein